MSHPLFLPFARCFPLSLSFSGLSTASLSSPQIHGNLPPPPFSVVGSEDPCVCLKRSVKQARTKDTRRGAYTLTRVHILCVTFISLISKSFFPLLFLCHFVISCLCFFFLLFFLSLLFSLPCTPSSCVACCLFFLFLLLPSSHFFPL